MKGNDNIKDLFSEKLGNFEAPVNPELWSGISSQLATTAAQTAAGGLSVLTKTLIGFGIVAATVVSIVLVTNNDEPVKKPAAQPQVVKNEVSKTDEPIIEKQDQPSVAEAISIDNSLDSDNSTDEIEQGISVEYPLHEPITHIELPVEGFEERVTKEDEPLNEVSEESVKEDVAVEDGGEFEKEEKEPEEELVEEAHQEEPEEKERVSIVLPNVFTPDNDNVNDYYEIKEGADGLKDFSIFIYNTTGEIVFRSDNPHFKWNGMNMKQEPVPAGRYMCVVIATDAEGNSQKTTKQFDLFK